MFRGYFIGLFVGVCVWTAFAAMGNDIRPFVPWPWDIIRELLYMLGNNAFWMDVSATLFRTASSFLVASVIGVVIGAVLGSVRILSRLFTGLVDFLRAIPATAFLPIVMLFLGVGELTRFTCVVLGSGLIVIVYTAGAVRNINDQYLRVADTIGLKGGRRFRLVVFPAALSEVGNGLSVSLAISLVLVVVLEMFAGAESGLGYRLFEAQQTFRVREMYATLLTIGILGSLVSLGFDALLGRVVHWGNKI